MHLIFIGMTVDEFLSLLSDMPGDAEMYIDTGLSVNALFVGDGVKVEFDDDSNAVVIIL